jgi:drug/metabolite transporter (DMT)-like permease
MGAFGLLAFYRGLSIGRMGVVAPVAAVVSAVIPVVVGIFFEGWPGVLPVTGFVLAVIAVWLVSSGGEGNVSFSDVGHAVVAGLGFAAFFVIIDRVSAGAVFWPLVAARTASISLMFGFALLTKRIEKPTPVQMPVIFLAGLFDTGGNVFFILAAQAGRLDVSAVLSSLYSAVTVFLAWLILKETMTIRQWVGVIAAFTAVILVAN